MKPTTWFTIVALAPGCFSSPSSSGSSSGGGSGGGCTSTSSGSSGTVSSGGGCNSTGGSGGSGSGSCTLFCSPPRLDIGTVGAGLVLDVSYTPPSDHSSFTVATSDPTVLEASLVDGRIEVTGHHAGTVFITTHDATTGEPIDSEQVDVVDVATIAVHFRIIPGADQPISALAALAGTSDAIDISYLASDDSILAGNGQISLTGTGITFASADQNPPRLSDEFLGHQAVQLVFAAAGSGQLVIDLVDGQQEVAIPIDIVDDTATLALIAATLRDSGLVAAPDPLAANDLVVIDAIGRTADGRFVAGVVAQWSAAGAIPGDFTAGPSSENVFVISAGSTDITATVGAKTATQHLDAQ